MFDTPLKFPEYSNAVEFLRHNEYYHSTNRSVLDPPESPPGYRFESDNPAKDPVIIRKSREDGIEVEIITP
jgi:hypothetical protein